MATTVRERVAVTPGLAPKAIRVVRLADDSAEVKGRWPLSGRWELLTTLDSPAEAIAWLKSRGWLGKLEVGSE